MLGNPPHVPPRQGGTGPPADVEMPPHRHDDVASQHGPAARGTLHLRRRAANLRRASPPLFPSLRQSQFSDSKIFSRNGGGRALADGEGRRKKEAMAVRATVSRFPIDPDAQEGSGLPWGITVAPFAPTDENGNPPAYGSGGHLLPRCENCWAYFNAYCELDQWAWNCSLCGTLNGLSSECIDKYSRPQSCPEMSSSFIDLELPGEYPRPIELEVLVL